MQNRREIRKTDDEGNVWRIVMYSLPSKTNRFQLSFFFNEKEFELSKLQSNRSAQDLWDLLSKIRKGTAEQGEMRIPSCHSPSSCPDVPQQQEAIHEQQ